MKSNETLTQNYNNRRKKNTESTRPEHQTKIFRLHKTEEFRKYGKDK